MAFKWDDIESSYVSQIIFSPFLLLNGNKEWQF